MLNDSICNRIQLSRNNKLIVNHEHDQSCSSKGEGDTACTQHPAAILNELEAKGTDKYSGSR